MGLSLIVKGADYSAVAVGNAFFPFYESLVGARFYGSAVPDLTAMKKAKTPGPLTLGAGMGAMVLEPYSINPQAGQTFSTELTVPADSTVVQVVSLSGYGNQTTRVGGTEPAATGNFAGNLITSVNCDGVTLLGGGFVGVNAFPWASNTSQLAGQPINAVLFANVDSTNLTARMEVHSKGAIGLGNAVTLAAALTPRAMLLGHATSAGAGAVTRHRAVAVFNRVLTPAERLKVMAWLKTFYATKGITI